MALASTDLDGMFGHLLRSLTLVLDENVELKKRVQEFRGIIEFHKEKFRTRRQRRRRRKQETVISPIDDACRLRGRAQEMDDVLLNSLDQNIELCKTVE